MECWYLNFTFITEFTPLSQCSLLFLLFHPYKHNIVLAFLFYAVLIPLFILYVFAY